jgi:hypothetical protein
MRERTQRQTHRQARQTDRQRKKEREERRYFMRPPLSLFRPVSKGNIDGKTCICLLRGALIFGEPNI